jgi:hypothetical protein
MANVEEGVSAPLVELVEDAVKEYKGPFLR